MFNGSREIYPCSALGLKRSCRNYDEFRSAFKYIYIYLYIYIVWFFLSSNEEPNCWMRAWSSLPPISASIPQQVQASGWQQNDACQPQLRGWLRPSNRVLEPIVFLMKTSLIFIGRGRASHIKALMRSTPSPFRDLSLVDEKCTLGCMAATKYFVLPTLQSGSTRDLKHEFKQVWSSQAPWVWLDSTQLRFQYH